MAFDLATAKPEGDSSSSGFDLSTAKPVDAKPRAVQADVRKAEPPTVTAFKPSTKMERFTESMDDPFVGLGQLASHLGMGKVNEWIDKLNIPGIPKAQDYDQLVKERNALYEERRKAAGSTGFDWMKLGGNMLSPENLLTTGRAATLPSMAAKTRGAAASGLAQGMMTPVTGSTEDFSREKSKQGVLGAGFGAAAPQIGQRVERAVAPKVGDAARYLAEKGVNLTPGAAFGPVVKRFEDAATSIPLVGDVIKSGKTSMIESLNRAMGSRALEPIGEKLPKDVKPGRDTVAYIDDKLNAYYDSLLPKMKGQLYGNPQKLPAAPGQSAPSLYNDLNQLKQLALNSNLEQSKVSELTRFIDREIIGKFQGQGALLGQSIKDVQSIVRTQTEKWSQSENADYRTMAQMLREASSKFKEMIQRENPALKPQLDNLDRGWATFKQLQRASKMTTKDEAFSPNLLSSAVRASDKTKDDAAYAAGVTGRRGGARNQDLTDPASKIMPSSLPESGTTPRHIIANILTGGGAGYGASMLDPHTLAAVLAATGTAGAAYSKPGMAALRHYITPAMWRQMLGAGMSVPPQLMAPQIPAQMQQR